MSFNPNRRSSIVTPADFNKSMMPDSHRYLEGAPPTQEATDKAISKFIWFFLNNVKGQQGALASFTDEANDKAVMNPFVFFPAKQVTCMKSGHDDTAIMLTGVQMCIFPKVQFKVQGKMMITMSPPMFDRVAISGRIIKVYFDRINPKEEWHITI